ncbi:hypothetical protein LTR86_000489 [Recurvomyces mirabilis]|nr:hypothetical protein LTR86_000489 [Recurvomyces mirabilis]
MSLEQIWLMPLSVEEEDLEDLERGWEWIPARGKTGRIINFTFYYASRMALELKIAVPTIPVAAADSEPAISQSTPISIFISTWSGEDTTILLAVESANKKRYANENAPSLLGSTAYKRVKVGDGGESAHTVILKTKLSEPAQTQEARQRKKARLQFQLEEIQTRQRLMELEDE